MRQILLPGLSEIPEYRYECADALEFSRTIPNESVKLVMTSPPYNVGESYEVRRDIQEYIADFEPLIAELVRVLKNDGSICWQVGNFVDEGEVFPLDIYFYPLFKSHGLKLRNRIIWHFGHGLHCSKRFSGRYEVILWFTKSDSYTFNLDDVRIPSKYPGKRYFKGARKGELSGNPKGKNPEDIWEMTKLNHPCQYPVELAERCILALTDKGDAVYDPFAGVGSTLIAALKNEREALGSEYVSEYVDIGMDRIESLKEGTLITRPIYKEIYEP